MLGTSIFWGPCGKVGSSVGVGCKHVYNRTSMCCQYVHLFLLQAFDRALIRASLMSYLSEDIQEA
jgi:hypothetical protein